MKWTFDGLGRRLTETGRAAGGVLVVLALVLLWILSGCLLVIRQFFHLLTLWADDLFDGLAKLAGFEPQYWPLPKASDSSLPYADACFKCRRQPRSRYLEMDETLEHQYCRGCLAEWRAKNEPTERDQQNA